MIDEVLSELKDQYKATIKQLNRELTRVRTGRANLSMLDSVFVDYYGSPTPLSQVATLKIADPRLITAQPWEKNLIGEIERAIVAADLGLNPSNDGVVVRIPIPALTGERRQELVKQVRRSGENHKVSLRNQRRDANDTLKSLEKDSEISEDDMRRALNRVNALTEEYTKEIDAIVEKKESDILEV